MHYTTNGDPSSQWVICLHGLGGSSETFTPLLSSMTPSFYTIRVDFPGFGQSAILPPPGCISIGGLVDAIHDPVLSLQTTSSRKSPMMFVGHSLGAIVAMKYAAKYPTAVAGLFLLGPGRAAGHIPAAKSAMLRLAEAVRNDGILVAAEKAAITNFYPDSPGRAVDPTLRKAVYDAVSASDPEGYAQTCEAIVDQNHKDPVYSNIKCPVVFVAGDKDTISPVSRPQGLAALVGGPAVVEIVSSGHQPILEDLVGVSKAFQLMIDIST